MKNCDIKIKNNFDINIIKKIYDKNIEKNKIISTIYHQVKNQFIFVLWNVHNFLPENVANISNTSNKKAFKSKNSFLKLIII